MQDLTLVSSRHLRYENRIPVMGMQYCGRAIIIENKDFTEMFKGLPVTPSVGFLVRMVNTDIRNTDGSFPQMMQAKLMSFISDTQNRIELRGVKLQSFGTTTLDYSDYGITLWLENRKVVKCVLHMFDRNIDIEYYMDIQ